MAIVDWRVTPQISINDPVLMVGMPLLLPLRPAWMR
jgi:alcohol dehydrogenase class IV